MPLTEPLLRKVPASYGTINADIENQNLPQPAPPQQVNGWGHIIANFFADWSLKKKITVGVAGTGVLAAAGFGLYELLHRPENVMNMSAQEICARLPQVAAPYLQWTKAPDIASLQGNITQLVTNLCPNIPALFQTGQQTLNTLNNDLANQSTFAITGYFYNVLNPDKDQGIPYNTFNLIYHCLSDFVCSNQTAPCNPWLYQQSFYPLMHNGYLADKQISLETFREMALMGLSAFCNRMGNQPVFSAGNYTCGPVEQIANVIRYIATYPNVWPS